MPLWGSTRRAWRLATPGGLKGRLGQLTVALDVVGDLLPAHGMKVVTLDYDEMHSHRAALVRRQTHQGRCRDLTLYVCVGAYGDPRLCDEGTTRCGARRRPGLR